MAVAVDPGLIEFPAASLGFEGQVFAGFLAGAVPGDVNLPKFPDWFGAGHGIAGTFIVFAPSQIRGNSLLDRRCH